MGSPLACANSASVKPQGQQSGKIRTSPSSVAESFKLRAVLLIPFVVFFLPLLILALTASTTSAEWAQVHGLRPKGLQVDFGGHGQQ